MGNCPSVKQRPICEAALRRPLVTNEAIEDKSQAQPEDFNVLLLGPGKSGKSTIVRQLEMMYQNGYTPEQRMRYRNIIRRNLLESIQCILVAMRGLGLDCLAPENRPRADRILAFEYQESTDHLQGFDENVAREIYKLWQDPIISIVIDRSHDGKFSIPENASYFLTNAFRIGTLGYLPTEADVLRSWQRSPEFMEAQVTLDSLTGIRLIELGEPQLEQMGRRQWLHYFANVASVVYCTSLSDYDRVLADHPSETRLAESLMLFDSVINSRWFRKSAVVLILNKIDVFKRKLSKTPINSFFPEYAGGANVDDALAFISNRFLQANRSGLSVYLHVTQAIDPSNDNSLRQVPMTVKDTILANASRDVYIL